MKKPAAVEDIESGNNGCQKSKNLTSPTPSLVVSIASVLTFLEAIAGLTWNVPIVLQLSWNATDAKNLADINLKYMDNLFGVYGTALTLAILNCQVVMFALLLLKSNVNFKVEWMRAWCCVIAGKSFVEISLGYFYFDKYNQPENINTESLYRLAVLSSGIFFFWPLSNLYFAVVILKRSFDVAMYNEAIMDIGKMADLTDLDLPPPYKPRSEPKCQPKSQLKSKPKSKSKNKSSEEKREEKPDPVPTWKKVIESPMLYDPFF